MLSDLSNIERVKDKIPEDKLKDVSFDKDSISVGGTPVGTISMRIIEREEPKTIKFESENAPMSFNFWIQLLPTSDTASKMKLTIKADIPIFLKGMVSGPLQEAIEKIARERYFMKTDDEDIFVLSDDDRAPKSIVSDEAAQ